LIVELLLEVSPSKPELTLDYLTGIIGALFRQTSYQMLIRECG